MVITGVILARNERDNIVDCIRMLRPHVGEIILIDMESTDGTVEAARPHVDNVLSHPLTANFDAARNVAINVARFNWLWFVDADERVPVATGNAVNDVLRQRGDEFVALWIPFKSYFCGQWMQHCGWWPGYTMPRVLKRGHFRFANRLHGGVQLDGPDMRFPSDPNLSVEHFSYKSIEHYLEKFNRYTSVEAQNLAEDGQTLSWEAAVREMVRDLWLYYEKNEGRLDGRKGWILSWLAGQYRWFSRTKLLDVVERNSFRSKESSDRNEFRSTLEGEPDVPPDLDSVFEVMAGELARLRGRKLLSSFGVVFRSPLFDLSGYADDGRVLLRALAGGQRQVAAEEIRWSDVACGLSQSDQALFRALLRAKRPPQSISITNCIPTLCKPDPNAVFNIIRTTFETDRVPGQWLPLLNEYDEVWVLAKHTMHAFRRAGVAAEKLHTVPGFTDTEIFTPEGNRMPLPEGAGSRSFVFLSVFDWQLRKGWDILLKAYCQEFAVKDDVALLLKITRGHGHSIESIHTQIDEVLGESGQSLKERPDIVLWEKELTAEEMASLYRGVEAFVLPTRGEGWGRPLMEAMACGLPTIGTAGSGNSDFMSEENSFLIPAKLVPVSAEAADEIAVYRGHKWLEPSLEELRKAMRTVASDASRRKRISRKAAKSIQSNFGIAQAASSVEQELHRIANRLSFDVPPPPKADQIRVELEGEFFASHSFSNINEQLALQFIADRSVALSIRRVHNQPTHDDSAPNMHRIKPYMGRAWEEATQVTIRHAFPPNWSPVAGKWVHIQPWEFGALPLDWVEPILENIDEIWVPSNYVRNVYLRSGIPEQRIQVIPWGVDPNVFAPDVPPLLLPCEGKFVFLFVGGTIARKGFDLLLNAYLTEFSHDDVVSLVIKDLGASSFYRFGNARQQILQAIADPSAPHLVYLDEDMTPGQLASLYAAADCFVAPYRGEGFGLPILEAMACGVAPIVPRGGASDDFVDEDTAYLLPAEEVECEHAWRLCGIGTELAIETRDIREAMRKPFEQRDRTREMGQLASTRVRQEFTWESTARQMLARICGLPILTT